MDHPRRSSLQVQLPVAAATLFLTLAAVLTVIVFQRSRQQSLDLASSRLIRLADRLSGSIGQSVPRLIESATTAAADADVVRLLTGRPVADTAALLNRLQPMLAGEADNSILALWDLTGHRVHTFLEAEGIGPWVGPPVAVDAPQLTAIRRLQDSLFYYDVVAPVMSDGQPIGYLQRRSRVTGSARTQTLAETLLGEPGELLFGSAAGPWTDLDRSVSPPPAAAVGATDAVTYERDGAERLGVGRPIVGTPWLVVAELPRQAVLAPSRAFLVQLAAIALVQVVAATVAAWVLGRRITGPLRSLVETAEAIRDGEVDRRAATDGHPELVTANVTFNAMADNNARQIRALHINEERLRSLIAATARIVWWTDGAGQVGERSAGWREFTGQTVEEVRGAGWLDAVHPEDRDWVRQRWAAAVAQGSEFDAEYRVLRHDGEYRWLHSRGVPVLGQDGAVREWIRAASDITPVRQIAARLERREEELVQAQRLDAIGRLAGGIAHDFNNLLTAILVPAELALEQVPADSPLRADLEEICGAGKRATALTSQLLAFGRQQVLRPEVVEFDGVIAAAGRIARRLIPESIEVEVQLGGAHRHVRVDPTQLEQVVINLVVNARDAMPQGGRLLIETRMEDLGAEDVADHEGVEPGRYLMLAVTDTGTGMDADTRERIFDPFFTTKEKGRGTGLGLATVYGIIKQSGGHIWLYSEPGRGTVVKAYFPEAAADGVPESGPKVGTVPTGTGTILFVEDDEAIRRIGERMLRRLGYTVLTAPDAATALEIVARDPHAIDLLVTDVVMPGMSGPDLADAIHERRPKLPVLLLSGWTGDDAVRRRILEGAVPFLQKPFTLESLGRKVGELLGHAPTHPEEEGR